MIRAGMLAAGCGLLGQLLAADPGYRGPRVPCGRGHEAQFASYRLPPSLPPSLPPPAPEA